MDPEQQYEQPNVEQLYTIMLSVQQVTEVIANMSKESQDILPTQQFIH
jgi:hypothetical protein